MDEIDEKIVPVVEEFTNSVKGLTAEVKQLRDTLVPAATNKGYIPLKTHLILTLATVAVLAVPLMWLLARNESKQGIANLQELKHQLLTLPNANEAHADGRRNQ